MVLMFDTPKFELEANNGPLIRRVAIAMIILSFIGICLRFLSRRLVQQPYLWDDWIIVLALPLSWIICILEIISSKNGLLGRHVELATEETIKDFFKQLYVIQLLYNFSIALTKFSIMVFYRRIFTAKQTRIPLMVLGAVVGAWLIATSLVAIFSCTPIHDFWDRTASAATCINTSVYFMAGGATNIATDIAILLFPVPIVWKLQIYTAQKFALLGVFLLGGFIIIVSCLRLVAIAEANGDPDFTWAYLPLAVWTTIEVNVAIFCACIPCLGPLLRISLGKAAYKGGAEKKWDIRGRVYKRWWPSIRTEQIPDEVENGASFLWLGDTADELPSNGTRTVISSNGAHGLELPDLHKPKLKNDAIRVERNVERMVTWARRT